MQTLSIVTIAKNEAKHLKTFLETVKWVDEIIIVNNASTDTTEQIARKYTGKVYTFSEGNLGKLKQHALTLVKSDWILVLDVDEILSPELVLEIKELLSQGSDFDAYKIPYQNHFLGHPLKCKAQQYSKIRLFKKGHGSVLPVPVHEEVVITGNVGKLQGKINHYSFRSIRQTLAKFTDYAIRETPQLLKQKKQVGFKQLTLFPLHMFWSIFIEGKGYQDHIWGFLLALCFMYYEWARYFYLRKSLR